MNNLVHPVPYITRWRHVPPHVHHHNPIAYKLIIIGKKETLLFCVSAVYIEKERVNICFTTRLYDVGSKEIWDKYWIDQLPA